MPLEDIAPKVKKPTVSFGLGQEEPKKEETTTPTDATKLPETVQPTEYFEGYKWQLERWSLRAADWNAIVTKAYKDIEVLTGAIRNPLTLWFRRSQYQRNLKQRQADLDAALQQLAGMEWRLQVLHTLPAYFASTKFTINNLDDVMNLIPNELASDIDMDWLQDTYDRMSYLNNKLPEEYEGSVSESQEMILNEILKEPKLETKSLHNLTVDELAKYFTPMAAELPESMTIEQVRSVLSRVELDSEADIELSAWLIGRARDWAVETDRLNLIKAGITETADIDLTPSEFFNALLVQPFMATTELLDKYFSLVARPLAGAAVIGFHRLFNTPEDTMAAEMSRKYDAYRESGENAWNSLSLAVSETEMPWYTRMLIEGAFDPTTYIGIGIAPALATKAGTMLTKIGVRGLGTRIGPFVASVENGYVRGADALFRAGVELVVSPIKGSFWLAGAGYQIPKTITQMSRNFARQASMNFKSVLDRAFPQVKNLVGLTAKDIRDTASACIDAAIARPTEGGDLMVRAGSNMLEFDALDTLAAKKLLKGIADDFEFDVPSLARLNDEVLNMFSGQPAKMTAGKILGNLAINQTDEVVEKVVKQLATFKDDVVAKAKAMFSSDKSADQLIGMFEKLSETRYANLASPIATHLNQAGMSVSWVSRVADKVLQSTGLVTLERKAIMPFARWNLLFMNFGPMNFFENMQRSFLGGGELMYPKAYGGLAETNRLFRGLTNAPYELQMAERGAQRLEMALVDPKTGVTNAFRGGKIPFVTKEVNIRGHVIGKKINIRGKDFKLTDFQSYNDMWEEMTTLQRAYDYQVHYMKALPETASEEMRMIVEAVDSRINSLKGMKGLSNSDIQDIRRTAISTSTVGPDEFRHMADLDVLELQKRMISKELGKTFDKCTEVASFSKKGIRDDVLDGSIFKDIKVRIDARKQEAREMSLASLANQIDALKSEADNMIKAYTNTGTLLDELSQDIALGTPTRRGVPAMKYNEYPITLSGNDVGSIMMYESTVNPGEFIVDKISITKAGTLNRRTLQDIELLIHNTARSKGATTVTVMPKPNHKALYELGGYSKTAVGYSKATKSPLSRAPKSIDELLTDMDNISAMQNAIDERIHDYRRLVELRSAKLTPGKEVDDFHVGSNKLMSEFMDSARADMNRIIDQTNDFLSSRPVIYGPKGEKLPTLQITDAQTSAAKAINEIYRQETANVLNTRNRLAAVEARIPKTPPAKRNARFWQQQRAEKASIWDEHELAARRLHNLQMDSSRQFLSSVGKTPFVPAQIPAVTGKLTPSHIAHLFGVTGDDTYRGLTRIHTQVTVRPKEEWVDYVKNQANAYAQKFQKTAIDIGFTDEAIGDVYDQLWRNLGIEPSILTPDSPTMLQFDEIEAELTRLHAAVKMDETDIAKWRQFNQGMADDLEKMPMYQKAAPAMVADTPESIAERLGSKYNGMQEMPAPEAPMMMFTDDVTGSTYLARNFDEALEALTDMRRNFGAAAPEVKPLAVPARGGSDDWWAKKELAMTEARKQHELAYPTYDDANIIDESMRAIFPFWTYEQFRWRWLPRTFMRTPGTLTNLGRFMDYCVPISYRALTRNGWKYYDELTVGEDVMVVNPVTLESYWSPLKAVNVFPASDRNMVSIPKHGGGILCTQEHSWLVRSKLGDLSIRKAKDITEQYYGIPTVTDFAFPSGSILSPKDAATLGWLVTDGSYKQGIIYQKKAEFVFNIEVELGITPTHSNSNGVLSFYVPKAKLRELLSICPDKTNLPSIVSKLDKDSSEAMWNAMMSAEGNSNGALEFRSFAQKPGPVLDAFTMLSIMLGYKISIEHTDGTKVCSIVHIWKYKNDKPWRRVSTKKYTDAVWCPTVETGVWIMDAGGQILPTGNTDGGYINVPGTDLQINPLRGSIWMGGMRRFFLKDFPEYYDKFPGAELIDYIGRAGFYPGIHITGLQTLFGAATGKPELNELVPTWMQTGLSALRALSPEHMGKVIDYIFPDRFRDYQTMLTLGEWGYDADEIWNKKYQGQKLTPEEESLWLRAEAQANGLKGILMEQTGMFRIRPQEYDDMQKEMKLAIQDATGVSVATQNRIDRLYPITGKRFSDYYKLDVLQTKLLYESESYRRWQGVTTPLYPSSWQALEVKIKEYWDTLEKNSTDARRNGVYDAEGELKYPSIVEINRQFVTGEIGPDQWKSLRENIMSGLAEAADALAKSPAYADVPKTLEEREAWLREKGILTPTYGADQELLWYYYQLEPELAYNWDSDRMELDWDTYYAKVDMLMESLTEPYRQRLLDRIQLDWTPMERLYWTASRNYFRPYRNIRTIVLNQYTDEERGQIRRYEVARGEEREALQDIIGSDGQKLIAGFNARVREARQKLRYIDSDLDAWSYFFGNTDSFITAIAEEKYNELVKQYMNESMVQ